MGSILFTDFHKLEQNILRIQFTWGGVILITPLLDSNTLLNNHSCIGRPEFWLTDSSTTANRPDNSLPLIINRKATGYYRVNYDQDNWDRHGNCTVGMFDPSTAG